MGFLEKSIYTFFLSNPFNLASCKMFNWADKMDKLCTLSKGSLIIKNVAQSKYSNTLMFHFSNSLSECQPNVIRKQDKEVKMGRKVAQKRLTEMLNIKPIKALEIITSHKSFYQARSSLISENYEICTLNKLSKDIVLKYPYILIENDLSKKIEMLNMLPIKLCNSIPLVKLSVQRLKNICLRSTETATRINDLCRIFNITHCESCEILGTKHFLFAVHLNHLEGLIKRLTENGMPKEDMLKDMWIFKYSEPYIINRLQCINENRVQTVKPWMMRCPEETLFKHIKRESDNRDILGENSVAEYLSERLKCSESIAKYLIRKQPALQTKSLLKLDEMIDFLYKHGFTPSQICRIPKVLLHSTKTAENRIKELTALGNKPDNLYILTKSQKQYMQYIETLIKAKSKPKTI